MDKLETDLKIALQLLADMLTLSDDPCECDESNFCLNHSVNYDYPCCFEKAQALLKEREQWIKDHL